MRKQTIFIESVVGPISLTNKQTKNRTDRVISIEISQNKSKDIRQSIKNKNKIFIFFLKSLKILTNFFLFGQDLFQRKCIFVTNKVYVIHQPGHHEYQISQTATCRKHLQDSP